MNKLILTLLALGFCAVACAKNNTYHVDGHGVVTMGATKKAIKSTRDMTESDKLNFFIRLFK